MTKMFGSYVMTFQAERFHKTVRYHWLICSERNPDRLVSWGYASTQELALAAAQNEVTDLCSGLTQGGPAISKSNAIIHRRCWREP